MNKERLNSSWFSYGDREILYQEDGIVIDLLEGHVNIGLYGQTHPYREALVELGQEVDYAAEIDWSDSPSFGHWASISTGSFNASLDDLITVLQYAKLKITERQNKQSEEKF